MIFAFLIFAKQINAQVDPNFPSANPEEGLEELIEIIGEESESDIDIDGFIQSLQAYKKRPLNLNKASYQELNDFLLLSPEQIDALIHHRKKSGTIISLFELQSIRYFDLNTINRILPYVTVNRDIDDVNMSIQDFFLNGQHTIVSRYQQLLQQKRGFEYYQVEDTCDASLFDCDTVKNYLGNSHKYFFRYRHKNGNRLSYGITAEKDEGEEFFRGSQKQGFDYYSAHFYLRDYGPFKYLALGDYELKFGQGLTIWSGLGFRKSSYVLQTKKQGFTVKPYTSVNEFFYRRGAAASFQIGDIELTAFGSYKPVDANITAIDSLEEETDEISSLQESGLHRTLSELEDKNAIKETMFGAHAALTKREFEIGLTGMFTKYSADLSRNIKPYNQYLFAGNSLINASVDYRYLFENFHFFGETAISDNSGIATINGVVAALDPKVSFTILHRHFNKSYQAFYGQAFAEGSDLNNETGLYFGTSIKPSLQWTIDAYFDTYQHPWLKFRADAPSNGYDYLAKVTYKPNRKVELYVRYQKERKWQNTPGNDNNIDDLSEIAKTGLRVHARYKMTKEISFKSRFEVKYYQDAVSELQKGYLIYQDFDYQPWNFPVQFNARFALFDTDRSASGSSNVAMYMYEKDVLYTFSIPSFRGTGLRYYLNLRWKARKGIDVWLRYDETNFINTNSIFVIEGNGSGNDLINGNKASRVKAQVRFQF